MKRPVGRPKTEKRIVADKFGVRLKAVKAYGLDREMSDLARQVLVNQSPRRKRADR